jgi:integrase
MTPRKRKSRIYWRGGRAWGDFRDYVDAGGTREPLIPEGEKLATMDSDMAEALAVARLADLRQARQRRHETGRQRTQALAEAVRDHLIAKKKAGKVTDAWIAATEGFLRRAVEFFGAERELQAIRPRDVRDFAAHLATLAARKDQRKPRKRAAGKGRPAIRTMSAYSVRAHLFALSNLYRRARESELVPVGCNPVADLMEKPAIVRKEAKWLEVSEAALLLESARTLPPFETAAGAALGAALAYPFLATFLLTGGRYREVLGLELDDVSFDRKTVTFRPNAWRRLKTQGSWRVVPLFPQLEEILRAWVFGPRLEAGGSLLFPAPGKADMLSDTRKLLEKLLDRIGKRVGWKRGEIRHRIFRHTYCAARLQTLDRGAPVSPYVVSRELGHGSEEMVRRVYSPSARSGTAQKSWSTESSSTMSGSAINSSGCVLAQRSSQKGRDQRIASAPLIPRWKRGRDESMGPARLERATSCSGGKRSIQLSYGPVKSADAPQF